MSIEVVNEIIYSAAPALAVLSSSPIIAKLIDKVSGAISVLYEPKKVFNVKKAEYDAEIYKLEKEKERKANEVADTAIVLNSDIVTDIQNVLDGIEVNKYERYKLGNTLKAISYCVSELADNIDSSQHENDEQIGSESDSQADIDFDWLMRFFEATGNIGNDDLLLLWGKVLAGEVRRPGSCSLRLIDLVRNMTREEAIVFLKLSQLVMESGDCFFIMSYGFESEYKKCHAIIQELNLNYQDSIWLMMDCGLIRDSIPIATDFAESNVITINNQNIIGASISPAREEAFTVECYQLSTSGIELVKILRSQPSYVCNSDYAIECFRLLKETSTDVTIKAFAFPMSSDVFRYLSEIDKHDNLSDKMTKNLDVLQQDLLADDEVL